MKKQPSPIVPWIGGKRRLAKHILPLFPEHTCYVEPFCGAAALFFLKKPSKVEVINDINGDLMNLYRVVKHHPDEFLRQFEWSLVSREEYDRLKSTPAETLTDIQRAARFYYLQRQAFGGRVADYTFGGRTTDSPGFNLSRIREDLSLANKRLIRACIEHQSWEQCIERYDRPYTLFYCDPPYWGAKGYGVNFPMSEYLRMAQIATSMRGKMIILVNDIPEMRKAFAGLEIRTLDHQYSVRRGKGTPVRELVIRNF
ncbi:DNA adenine methylase [Salmonella enterica]|uniref:site-specific DNA-methyltransferase (adenine-specific) n=1 Tax=Salmonella enterica TaxID=28901 RepID=A0A633DBI0_SALER|nr:DNA adenine methylase [Salmonella enterica]EBW2603673.1 DNA adenine methylase [Salmonella enterica subsp. enterica serovar Poano]ECC0573632.1 DNA adenine methylase [Salmonella enterica]ECD7358551.1 DNA adenine methylase [Salmonella enterica subsp. enterica serovar Poano]ECY1971366.1 DNA adenine methylase [Salmonella enterica]